MITENETKLLKEWLPKGYYKDLALQLGFSERYIVRIVNGERNNEIILSNLIRLALKNKKRIEKLRGEIQKLAI